MNKPILTLFALAMAAGAALAQAPAPASAPAAPANDKYVVNKEWAQLPPELTPWNSSTSAITPDGKGNVVVLVRAAPYFRVFTREGKFVRAWGDAGLFTEPHSILFDNDGSMWATDSQGHVVYKFDANGKVLLTLGKKGVTGDDMSRDAFNRPNYIALGPNGDIYVSDGYVNSRVVVFDKTGKFLRIIGGTKGAAPGQLQLPHGVVLDSKGRLLVSDSDNKRISLFDKDGKFIESWPVQSRGGIVITKDDTVYVSEVSTGSVYIVKEGKIVDTVTGLGRPHGIGVDADGAIYASDSLNRAVMKITPKK